MRESGSGTFVVIPLRELFGFLIRGLPLALIFIGASVLAVWLLNRQRPVTYTATAYLLSVRQEHSSPVVRSLIPGSLDPTLYRAAAVDGPVLAAVRAGWNHDTVLPDDYTLKRNLRVLSDNQLQSSVVRVIYRSGSGDLSAAIANSVAAELVNWDRQRTLRPLQDWVYRLEQELGQIDAQLSAGQDPQLLLAREQLLRDLAELRSTLPLGQLGLLNPAPVPIEADGRGLLTSVAIAMVFGALSAYLLQLWWLTRPRPGRQLREAELTQ